MASRVGPPTLAPHTEILPSQVSIRLIASVAALVVVRWGDQREADQEAIAAFDGTPFKPSLALGSRWRDFCDLRGLALHSAFHDALVPALTSTLDAGAGALVRRVAPVLQTITELEDIEPAVRFVQTLPLTTLTDRDRALETFDALLRDVAEERPRGREILTPRPMAELIVELAAPEPGDRIYDPCFGAATVLAACARRVRDQLKTASPRAAREAQGGAFFGVEMNPEAFAIGLARMILAGVDQPALELGNSLERPLPRDRAAEGFDCIVAEPPLGGRLLPEAAAQFPIKATSAETLFLQHIAASLRPGGRAIVVLPEGGLFRKGADAAVRRMLLEEYCVESVVSHLPYSNMVRVGVLALRRDTPGTRVRIVDAGKAHDEQSRLEWDTETFDPAALAATVRGERAAYDVREVPVNELLFDGATFMPARIGSPWLAYLEDVRAADRTVAIWALGHAIELFAGLRLKPGDLAPGADPALLGLLGPAEIENGETRPPTRFLAPHVAVPPNLRLRSGDVLLTCSGVVGRAAVVANGAMGRVAGNGLLLLRPDASLSPHYLAAMLQSAPVGAWMKDHARGTTVRSLPLAELRLLEIPVPELPLQDRVLRVVRHQGVDPTAALLQALRGASEDPIAQWLESSEAVRTVVGMREGRPPEPKIIEAFMLLAIETADIRTEWLDERWRGSDLASWFSRFKQAIDPMWGVDDVPAGPALIAVVDIACRLLIRALDTFAVRSPEGPAAKLAWDVTRTLTDLLDGLVSRYASSFSLVATLDPASVDAGTASAVTLRVRNQGPMPLRDLVVSTSNYLVDGTELNFNFDAKQTFLDAGRDVASTAAILAQKDAGEIAFHVLWRATQLDGKLVHGTFSLSLGVRANPEAPPATALGPSPYIVGSPIERGEMLYGRDDILRNIKRQLSTDHRANVILLEGNRRTGKTSILKHLEAPGELPGWIPVNTSLQGAEGSEGRAGLTSKEIFRLLTSNLAVALSRAGAPVWLPDQPPPDPKRHYEIQLRRALTAYFEGDHPFEAFEIYLKTVIDAVAPKRILLMLDEFDKIQEGIDAGITSPQIPENLRYLFHTHPELGGILSGSRRLTRLRNEYWSALFGIGYAVRVEPLAVEDARDLVTRPAAGRLVYAPDARDRIVELCARQPFLIQTLCNRIFEGADERGERTVTPDAVERAATAMTGDNEHFETLWGYAGTDRRRLILAQLCKLTRGAEGRALDVGVLEDDLTSLGVSTPDGLGEDMAHLRELELVDLETYDGYQRYRLTIPLVAEWIRRNKDFSDLARRAARVAEPDDPYG